MDNLKKVVERLQEEVDLAADWNKVVSVNRKDLVVLIEAFGRLTSGEE